MMDHSTDESRAHCHAGDTSVEDEYARAFTLGVYATLTALHAADALDFDHDV